MIASVNPKTKKSRLPEQQSVDDQYNRLFVENARRIDRIFLFLFLVQFFAMMIAACTLTPLTWSGTTSSLHVHVIAAFTIGAAASLYPAYLCHTAAGSFRSRIGVAIGQAVTTGLVIHILGGRIEAHFFVFVSLAFLSQYRDPRIIFIATAVVGIDHIVRASFYPQSLLGVDVPNFMRALEHIGWVAFENVVLIYAIKNGTSEWRLIAERHCQEQNTQSDLRQRIEQLSDLAQISNLGSHRTSIVVAGDDALANLSARLDADFDTLGKIIDETFKCANDVSSQSDAFASETSELVSNAIEQVKITSKIERAAFDYVTVAEGIRNDSKEATLEIQETATLVAQSSEFVEESSKTFDLLQNSNDSIAEIVNVVKEIADRGQLLAINATIEAARCTSGGHGFTIVARGIEELAESNRRAAKKIEQKMKETSLLVDASKTTSSSIVQHLDNISSRIGAVVHQVDRIATSVDSQSQNSLIIKNSLQQVFGISRESAKRAGAIEKNTFQLRKNIGKLNSVVCRFTTH